MPALLLFAAVLLLAVLLSERAHSTVLSLAAVFLLAGIVAGDGMMGLVSLRPEDLVVRGSAEVALLVILFTDGMRVDLQTLRSHWLLPSRALLIGLPLTVVGTALLAHLLVGFDWRDSFLIGAALGPTDPVFASAIVGREQIPERLRRMLNIESGLNDGLTLPVVLTLLATYTTEASVPMLVGEVLLGVAIGVAVPWTANQLVRVPLFAVRRDYEALNGVALGLAVLALAELSGGNKFLAAFAAGITVATLTPGFGHRIHGGGEIVATLAKFVAVFLFGALLSPSWVSMFGVGDWAFILLALVAVRPLSLLVGLAGRRLPWRVWVTAGWFGPKGFASVVYAVMILRAGLPPSERLFHLMAAVIAVSMVAHSSTDVVLAKWLGATPGGTPDEHPGSVERAG